MRYHHPLLTYSFLMTVGVLSSTCAQEYTPSPHYQAPSKKIASGLEVRVNLLGSSGRFSQDLTLSDPNGHELKSSGRVSDLTTKGGSLLLGYAREYRRGYQSSFLYVGFESQKWNDAYDSIYQAFMIGAEGGVGGSDIKFIYGGEFAAGVLDTGSDSLGYLATFTAEPYGGMRFLLTHNISINMRVGARFYSVGAVESMEGVNTLLSQNSAYTVNAQIGLGYSFY